MKALEIVGCVKVICFCLLSAVLCGCARPAPEAKQLTAAPATEARADAPETGDPTCCGMASNNSEGVGEAWQKFTESGRYRLARAEEMNFPKSTWAEWASDLKAASRTFQYAWGKRGFDTEKDHLVALVVDTTRDGPERFGLVIFSAPRGADEYRPYWLYRNRDLSRTMIAAPSGYLMITDHKDDGTRESCDVFWKPNLKRYICKPMKD
jgi:hypothetical protein